MTEWGEATCCLQINCWVSSKASCQGLELGFLWPLVGLTPIPQELKKKGVFTPQLQVVGRGSLRLTGPRTILQQILPGSEIRIPS